LLFVVIFTSSFVNHFSVLQFFGNAGYITAIDTDQLRALAIQYLNAFNFGVHISFLFFGLHIFLIGYLIVKSEFIPKILGILLTIALIRYGVDSFGNFL